MKVLQDEKQALAEENLKLRARLQEYEKKSQAATSASSNTQVGSLNLSALERLRKPPTTKKKAAVVANASEKKKPASRVNSSALLSSWGGGPTFIDLDSEDAEKDDIAQQSRGHDDKGGNNNDDVSDDEKDEEDEKTASDSTPAARSQALPPPRPQHRPASTSTAAAAKQQTKEPGWKSIGHLLKPPGAASAKDKKEAAILGPQTGQRVLLELSRDNIYSAASALCHYDPPLFVICLQHSVETMVSASYNAEGSHLQTFSPHLSEYLHVNMTMAAAAGSDETSGSQPPLLHALFPQPLLDKLSLVSSLLVAIAARTAAGPVFIDTVLRRLHLRCVASLRYQRISALTISLLGRASGVAAEAKKAEHRAVSDEELEEGEAGSMGENEEDVPTEEASAVVTAKDMDFSDSDSDSNSDSNMDVAGDDGKQKAPCSANAGRPQEERMSLLDTKEAVRAALALVLTATSLRMGLTSHSRAYARDLAYLAASSPSLVCPGAVLGVLCGAASDDGRAVCHQHMAYLGSELVLADAVSSSSSSSIQNTPTQAQWRRALLVAIKKACAGSTGLTSTHHDVRMREEGALRALHHDVDGITVADAFNLMGIHDVDRHARKLCELLQSSLAASPQQSPPISSMDAMLAHHPMRGAVAHAAAAPPPQHLTEDMVMAAYQQHWVLVLQSTGAATARGEGARRGRVGQGQAASSSSTNPRARLDRALSAVNAARVYFDAQTLSDVDFMGADGGPCRQGGWRGGPAGYGYSLQRRLEKRLVHAHAVLQNYSAMALGEAAPAVRSGRTGLQTAEGVALQLFAFTSVPLEMLLDAAAFLDFAAEVMRSGMERSTGNGGVGAEAAAAIAAAAAALRFCMTELAAIVSCAVLERTQFLSFCSAMGGIRAVFDAITSNASNARFSASNANDIPTMNALLQSLVRFLRAQPSFWAHPGRADMTMLMLQASALSRSHGDLSRELSAFVSDQSRRAPAFVINLDRRLDRWRSVLKTCNTHGLAAMRVSAFDGTLLAGEEAKDGSSIPETDVVKRWDSTLNSNFDSYCQANTATPMTNSERGCSASHLKTWRAIAALRGKLATRGDGGPSGVVSAPQLRVMRECLAITSWERAQAVGPKEKEEDWYLILEDDASVSEDTARTHGGFGVALAKFLRLVPAECDILYLGWSIPWGKASHPTVKVRGKDVFIKPSYIWQLHGYVLRGRAVDTLLASLPINAPLDNFIARLIFEKRLVAYALHDQLVRQEGSYAERQEDSDIRHSGRIVGHARDGETFRQGGKKKVKWSK